MDKIFDQAKDKNVASFKVYGKVADHKVYAEAAYTNQVKKAEIADAFKKGRLLVAVGDALEAPVMLDGGTVYTLAKTGEPTEAFDATKTYALGALVIHSGDSYKCTTAINSAAAWDATKWTKIETVDFVAWASDES